jgi:hypothetical protein
MAMELTSEARTVLEGALRQTRWVREWRRYEALRRGLLDSHPRDC